MALGVAGCSEVPRRGGAGDAVAGVGPTSDGVTTADGSSAADGRSATGGASVAAVAGAPVTLFVIKRSWHTDVGFAVADIRPPLASLHDALPNAHYLSSYRVVATYSPAKGVSVELETVVPATRSTVMRCQVVTLPVSEYRSSVSPPNSSWVCP